MNKLLRLAISILAIFAISPFLPAAKALGVTEQITFSSILGQEGYKASINGGTATFLPKNDNSWIVEVRPDDVVTIKLDTATLAPATINNSPITDTSTINALKDGVYPVDVTNNRVTTISITYLSNIYVLKIQGAVSVPKWIPKNFDELMSAPIKDRQEWWGNAYRDEHVITDWPKGIEPAKWITFDNTKVDKDQVKSLLPILHKEWYSIHMAEIRNHSKPILVVAQDEIDNSVTSTNWARINYGAAYIKSEALKGILSISVPNRARRVFIYKLNAKDLTVDMTAYPEEYALTSRMKQVHWGELQYTTSDIISAFFYNVGFSTNTLGGKSADADPTKTIITLGLGFEVGPYVSMTGGVAYLSNHDAGTPMIGVNFDTALIGQLFK